ncbi:MAG: methyltransferase [Acidobacteriota bacterium]
MEAAGQTVLQLLVGRWCSQALYTGVKLGIFDEVRDEPTSAAFVADELRLEPSMTYRLLRALASLGLLAEHENHRFTLTEPGKFLRQDHPRSLRHLVLLEEGPEHYAVWKHLGDIIRDGGRDGFEREYGKRIFEHARDEANYSAVFNAAMSGLSASEAETVLGLLDGEDLSDVQHLCDIAGGHGYLLTRLLQRYEHLRGTVFDLPAVAEDTARHWARSNGVSARCTYIGGNMFEAVPAADGYCFKHVLHDWNDEECVQILQNARRATRAGARALVAEYVVPDHQTPHFSKLFDLHMACACGGRERTEAEYAELFSRSGWRHTHTRLPQGGNGVALLEARAV